MTSSLGALWFLSIVPIVLIWGPSWAVPASYVGMGAWTALRHPPLNRRGRARTIAIALTITIAWPAWLSRRRWGQR